MRQSEVFGHAIALIDRDAELAVPLQQGHRHGRCAASGKLALVQAQCLLDLAAHQAANERDREQAVELGRGHLVVNPLLKLDPQARHREKDGGAGPLQIGRKGVQRLCKIHMHAGAQPAVLHQHTLHHVGQWQVRQHTVVRTHGNALDALL